LPVGVGQAGGEKDKEVKTMIVGHSGPPRPALPDLVVKHVEPSAWFVRPGDRVTLQVELVNQGTAPAGAFHVKADAGWDGQEKQPVEALQPGQTHTLQLGPLTIQTWTSGHSITVMADCDKEVAESKERNNKYDLTLWDPQPPAPPFPPYPPPHGPIAQLEASW
jgi:hypothetical protein